MLELLNFIKENGTNFSMEVILVGILYYKMKQSSEERKEFLKVLQEKENNLTDLVSNFKESFSEIIINLRQLSTRVEKVETKVEVHHEKWLENSNK